METRIVMKDFEIHSTPLEEITIDASKIIIHLDDIMEERYRISACPYQAFKITTCDCFSVTTYHNDFCFRNGIYHTHILEITNSIWIKELKNNLADECSTFLNEAKHYVFPLQENTIEFVAASFEISRVDK